MPAVVEWMSVCAAQVTGAASLDDGDSGAPCINLAHPETGAVTCRAPLQIG